MSITVAKCRMRLGEIKRDPTWTSRPHPGSHQEQLTLVMRMRMAEPETAGPMNLVACKLLPEVLYTLVQLPLLATCSSYA